MADEANSHAEINQFSAQNPMPEFVRNALNEHGLMDISGATVYQQNDYVGWIARAKLEATRLSALTRYDELRGGKAA
jgi:hypothetical protein